MLFCADNSALPNRAVRDKLQSGMVGSLPRLNACTEEIAGLVERVTFFNEESGFAVLRARELNTVLQPALNPPRHAEPTAQ